MRVQFALLALALVVLVHSADSAAVKKSCKKDNHVPIVKSCNDKRTGRIIKRAFVKLFCVKRRASNKKYTVKKFLNWYFKRVKNSNGFVPRSGFKKQLRQALPKKANARKGLLRLRKKCVGQWKRALGRKNNKVGHKEFVDYLTPVLSKKGLCKKSGGSGGKGGKGKKGVKCRNKRTGRIIKRAFVKLFCVKRRASNKKYTVRKFLNWYFKRVKNSNGFVPRSAFKKQLRQALPKKANARKGLLRLRKKCVGKWKRALGRKNNKVGYKEFVDFLTPVLSKKGLCKKKSNSGPSTGGSSNALPYCPPGYYKKLAKSQKCVKRAGRIIRRAFKRLFCHRKLKKGGLKPKRFLRRYFRFSKTKNGYLPRSALRRRVRRKLPKFLKKLRKRLVSIKTRCLKKFKRSLDKNKDFKISRKEFVRYFRPYLAKKGLCKSYRRKFGNRY